MVLRAFLGAVVVVRLVVLVVVLVVGAGDWIGEGIDGGGR